MSDCGMQKRSIRSKGGYGRCYHHEGRVRREYPGRSTLGKKSSQIAARVVSAGLKSRWQSRGYNPVVDCCVFRLRFFWSLLNGDTPMTMRSRSLDDADEIVRYCHRW